MGLNMWASLVLSFLIVNSVHGVDVGSTQTAHPVDNPQGICALFVWGKGYDCQEFMVPTGDGFLLSMQRVSKANVLSTDKEPVFLYHGVMQGGEGWVLNEPYESLSFILADSGYDVWIANTRTTYYTFGHTTYNRSNNAFWNWTFDDLVAYDLPAMLYFVNSMTAKPILYVGYSQGTQIGFAGFIDSNLASLVKKAVMLSPVAYLDHVISPLSRTATALFVDKLDAALGIYQYNFTTERENHILDEACKMINISIESCYSNILSLAMGPSCCLDQSKLEYYNTYSSQSTSARNMGQLAQLMRSGRFCKYDYDVTGNIEKYGSAIPPSYDVSKIPVNLPFLILYGGNDYLADEIDVKHVASELPGNVEMHLMANYSHMDMVFGTSAHVDAYPLVLKFLEQ